MPPVSTPTAASPPTAQSQSPPFIARSHSRALNELGHPGCRSRYNSRAAVRSRGPKRTMLAARNHITTVSALVAETNAGRATRVVRNSSRAPAPNSAAEPPRPSGGTRSGSGPSRLSEPLAVNDHDPWLVPEVSQRAADEVRAQAGFLADEAWKQFLNVPATASRLIFRRPLVRPLRIPQRRSWQLDPAIPHFSFTEFGCLRTTIGPPSPSVGFLIGEQN
jgi:hypothetical protein